MIPAIQRDELVNRIRVGELKLLDAQGTGLFETQHIPGAIRGSIEDPAGTLSALGDDLTAEIVVYCTDLRCTGSAYTAAQLITLGYSNVRRYPGGIADWVEAGHEVHHGGP